MAEKPHPLAGVAAGRDCSYGEITMRPLLVAALAVLALASGGAYADDVVVPVTVRPGPLALTPVTVVAQGAQTSITVTDARGKGAGWTLLARLAGPTGRTVVVTGVDTRCGERSTCTVPRTTIRYPVMLTTFRSTPVIDARRGTGMGKIVLTLRLGSQARLGVALRFAVRPS